MLRSVLLRLLLLCAIMVPTQLLPQAPPPTSAVIYSGTWDASTNTPTFTSGTASPANRFKYWVVSVAGTTTVDGISSWAKSDWILSNGTAWVKISNPVQTITPSSIPNLDASKITSGAFDAARIPSLNASKITAGQIALARGGTNADLSATGGPSYFAMQETVGGNFTIRRANFGDLLGVAFAEQIPTLPASQITSGTLALARGGFQRDMSTTGGTGFVLKQSAVGALPVAAALTQTEIGAATITSIPLTAVTATPAAPAAGKMIVQSQAFAGRQQLYAVDADNLPTMFQAHLASARVSYIGPGTSTTPTTLGTSFTGTGTVSHPAPTSTNLLTSLPRTNAISATTANAAAGIRSATRYWRGNAAGLGGFFCQITFGISTNTAASRAFIGLTGTNNPTSGEPSAVLNQVALQFDSTDATANWFIGHTTSSGTATRTDLGANAPRNTTDILRLTMYCKPNDSKITVNVFNVSTNTLVLADTPYSTNIPVATAFLNMCAEVGAAATGVAQSIDIIGMYLEIPGTNTF